MMLKVIFGRILIVGITFFPPLLLFGGDQAFIMDSINQEVDLENDWESLRTPSFERFINFGLDYHLGSGYQNFSDSYLRSRGRINFAIGLMTRINISPRLAFQLNSMYDFNSFHKENGILRRHSLTLPATVQLFFPSKDDLDFRPGIYAGPYYRRHFSIRDTNKPIPIEDFYYKSEKGVTMGVFIEGYGLRMGFNTLRALTDLNKIGDLTGRAVSNNFSLCFVF